jgi:nickel/cobalt transporter (NicO) family protein
VGFFEPLLLGLTLGVRHAFEPDHLAAITSLVARTTGPRAAAGTGAAWGFGHAVAIVALGTLLVASGVKVPVSVALILDLAVAAVLVVLGVQDIRGGKRQPTRAHAHAHRSTLVGFVHGASGTAAVTLLCLTTFTSAAKALGFLLVFALGALLSMSALSGLLAGPLGAIARRGEGAARTMRIAGGVVALAAAVLVVVAAIRSPGSS